MSNKCRIGYVVNGNSTSTCCYNDGYPEDIGEKLLLFYDNREKVEELIECGNIYYLGIDVDHCDKADEDAINHQCVRELVDYFKEHDELFLYVWANDWFICDVSEDEFEFTHLRDLFREGLKWNC